ncbi:MAG: hypothetical protein OEM02_04015 [Desulfobulbaceae bacterium]|nr:hypothetical protein [Desulfobulbaceae bacterium]
MMNITFISYISLFVLLMGFATVQAEESTADFLSSFIAGNYHLLGKAPDSNETYYGKLTLSQTEKGIMVQRTIKGKTTIGLGKMVKSLADKVDILRINFTENSMDYEETCLISGDLDNYPRITCHLYRLGRPDRSDKSSPITTSPGLEALFIDNR